MDGTLFQEISPIDRTGLLPGTNNTLSATWAQNVGRMLVRSAGFAGSVKATYSVYSETLRSIPYSPGAVIHGYEVKAHTDMIYLPWRAYGSAYPPAVYAFPQWGSIVVYYNLCDAGYFGGGEYFRTQVDNLTCGTVYWNGGTYFQWCFSLSFYAKWWTPNTEARGLITGISMRSPYEGMVTRTMPPELATLTSLGGIWLHWYAMGYDVNA